MIKNQFETVRFNELKRYLKTISDKTLSTNLKELEADKLIVRTEYPQIPPKVEYTLSERGKSLMTVLDQLCVWGEQNRLRNQYFTSFFQLQIQTFSINLLTRTYVLDILQTNKSCSCAVEPLTKRCLPDAALTEALQGYPFCCYRKIFISSCGSFCQSLHWQEGIMKQTISAC